MAENAIQFSGNHGN